MVLFVLGIVALAAILSLSIITALAFYPSGWVEFILVSYTAAIVYLLGIGYTLSVFHLFGTLWAWSAATVGLFALASGALAARGVSWQVLRQRIPILNVRGLFAERRKLPRIEIWIIYILNFTVIVTFLLNLAVALFATPENVDSLNYHIARVAYYLQYQNLGHFDANFWAQIVNANGSAILLSFVFLATNRNENAMQLVQLASYVVSLFAVYGIGRHIGGSRSKSWIAALIFGLLTEVLMEAVTTQNDLVLTACVGVCVYGLFAFRRTQQLKFIPLTIISLGLAAAVKVTLVTLLPSLLLIAIYTLRTSKWKSAGQAARVGAWSLVLGLLVLIGLVLPSGYLENYRVFGNPFGSQEVREEHSPVGKPISQILEMGTKNLLRISLDSLSLDGFPSGTMVRLIQVKLRALPVLMVQLLNLNLEEHTSAMAQFVYQRQPLANEDFSYWGILGFALVVPVLLWTLLGFSRNRGAWVLVCAALVSVGMVAYPLTYQIFHGRRFVPTALFAIPALVGFFTLLFSSDGMTGSWMQSLVKLIRLYVFVIILLGCVSAISAILFRNTNSIIPYYERSVFAMNRVEQLTRSHLENLEPLKKFEQLVPSDAVVAVNLDQYEYLFFGKGLTRTLLPVKQNLAQNKPLPPEAQFLLYQTQSLNVPPDDIALGENLYLRILKDHP